MPRVKGNGQMQFEGIWTPIATPYRDDFSVNLDALEFTVEFLISRGVHGIISAGTTGEYYAQDFRERAMLAGELRRLTEGRVPLVVGTGSLRTEDSIEYAKMAKDVGADGILVTTPPYSMPTGREIALHALAIDRAVDMPVMLYNYPGRMGVNMDEETFDRLGRSPNFRGIKESSGDINRLHMIGRDYPHLGLLCGMDDQALEFFAWGARGWVCAGSNFAPEAHRALYDACVVEGDFTMGRAIMCAILPLMRVLEQGGKFIQCIKHGMTIRGIPAGPPKKPLQPLNKDDRRALEEVIRTMDMTISAIAGETK